MNEKILVVKLDAHGAEKWRYEGEVIERAAGQIRIEALFMGEERPFMGLMLKRGDRWVETYLEDRWYNVMEIFDREDGALKGRYCNVTRPPQFGEGRVEYQDLYLDLWVAADGTQHVLDEDEFQAADLDDVTRQNALSALAELQSLFR